MSHFLDSVQEIELEVIEYIDSLWLKKVKEYTLNKDNFRTNFPCPDSHFETISILNKISQLIVDKTKEDKFSIRCPGKGVDGRGCMAALNFTVRITYPLEK